MDSGHSTSLLLPLQLSACQWKNENIQALSNGKKQRKSSETRAATWTGNVRPTCVQPGWCEQGLNELIRPNLG